MNEKTPAEDCDHKWEQVGFWDGKNTETKQAVAGPMAICVECEGSTYFTWDEWRALPEEIKIELNPHAGHSSS